MYIKQQILTLIKGISVIKTEAVNFAMSELQKKKIKISKTVIYQ